MNQAFKIINTVGLMNQTTTEKKWGQAPFRMFLFFVGNIYV